MIDATATMHGKLCGDCNQHWRDYCEATGESLEATIQNHFVRVADLARHEIFICDCVVIDTTKKENE